MQPARPISRSSSFFSCAAQVFATLGRETVLGALVSAAGSVDATQLDAWVKEIEILTEALGHVEGTLHLEFVVPRIGSRIDAVLVAGDVVFVIEFKVGEAYYRRDHLNQVWDYALDLKNFHKASHSLRIIPLLVATEASMSDASLQSASADGVHRPSCCRPGDLQRFIHLGLASFTGEAVNGDEWARSSYQPTPTIIEAARALYSQHSVEEITRNDAGAVNLSATSSRVEVLIDLAKNRRQKTIIFVTGVPGAGKTLVGLNVATKRRNELDATHAVFLSGNGPLVDVLREALIRDEVQRLRARGDRTRRGDVGQRVKSFIQNVHHFRGDGLRDPQAPAEHVVIFDEAQRAWNLRKTADFMKRKKGIQNFSQSEPEFLISYLDRHKDWAVVICLVGGGQEINDGEAGIGAWLDAIRQGFPGWNVYLSAGLSDSEYSAAEAIEALRSRGSVVDDPALHLAVSMRSFRAEHLSRFVKAVLDRERNQALELFKGLAHSYPIVITRDLSAAKSWIRSRARGTERFGLVASSSAHRLKPHAIDIRVPIDPVHYFLSAEDDPRSSWYLEDAATEFQVQGLELDWVCVTWDADLRFGESDWSYNSFRGSKWQNVNARDRRQYLRNAYRVLLTRARQGMVLFVPCGDESDATRLPAFYDSTYRYLIGLGIPVLGSENRLL